MPQVSILLATYNGEDFLEMQILSIIGQSFQDWELIIHDDGSHDETISIINKWKQIDSRIRLVEDGVVFGNAILNFMHLLDFSSAEFTMFCDQDDIWLEKKVENMLTTIKQKNNLKPQVVYSRAYVWDDYCINGIILPFYFPVRVKDFLFLNYGVNGCFSMFNVKMLELMKNQGDSQAMHDHVLQLLGITLGEVTYMREPLMLYRRHGNTVTNGSFKQSPVKRLLNNQNVPVIDKKHYEAIEVFYDNYNSIMNDDTSCLMKVYLDMPQMSLINRISNVVKYRFTIGESIWVLVSKIIVRPFFN